MRVYEYKSGLSAGRLWLVELMQEINHGRIEKIVLRDGEPDPGLQPRVVREVKFGADNDPRPERGRDDFLLKAQVIELFGHLDRMVCGTVAVLEVKHGLPFRMLIADDGF